MNIVEVFKNLAKKSARSHVSRSPANQARLHLEALETRMAPSGVSGSDLNPLPTDPASSSLIGS